MNALPPSPSWSQLGSFDSRVAYGQRRPLLIRTGIELTVTVQPSTALGVLINKDLVLSL